jgi:hypothetical protein
VIVTAHHPRGVPPRPPSDVQPLLAVVRPVVSSVATVIRSVVAAATRVAGRAVMLATDVARRIIAAMISESDTGSRDRYDSGDRQCSLVTRMHVRPFGRGIRYEHAPLQLVVNSIGLSSHVAYSPREFPRYDL